ncbi:MAG: hypothetical protein SYC29_13335 [Planctomycetota bacterium]|nr:hypothetical protein [Planctomycetota bacterium]
MIEEEPVTEDAIGTRTPVRCPRCGYDLRGEIASWGRSCPLEGVCAECGLEIAWRELLNPVLIKPRWCVEYAGSSWRVPGRAVRTLMAMCWPWYFWRSLRMVHEIRWRRVRGCLLFWAFALYLLFCACHAALMFSQWSAWGLRMPAKLAHPLDVLMAAVLPASDSLPWKGVSALSPCDVLVEIWVPVVIVPVLPFAVIHLLSASGFVTLPVSRRRARVRWAHIGRILLYGLGWFVPVIALTLLGVALSEMHRLPVLPGLGRLLIVLAAVALWSHLPFLVIWWSTATGRYLKMRHPWGVGLAVVAMAGLLTLVVPLVYALLAWRVP